MLGRMAVPASLRSRVPRPGFPRPAAGPARPAPAPAATLADPATLPPLDPQRRHWPGREMTSGGVTLHVRETPGPDGCPAVYVHGLGGSALNWTDLAAAADDTLAAALGVTGSLILVGGGLWLQHCCRTPDDPDDDGSDRRPT